MEVLWSAHTNSRSRDLHSSERGFLQNSFDHHINHPPLTSPDLSTNINPPFPTTLTSAAVPGVASASRLRAFGPHLPGACCFLLGKPLTLPYIFPYTVDAWCGPARPGWLSGGSEGRREAQEDPCSHHLHTAYGLETSPSVYLCRRRPSSRPPVCRHRIARDTLTSPHHLASPRRMLSSPRKLSRNSRRTHTTSLFAPTN